MSVAEDVDGKLAKNSHLHETLLALGRPMDASLSGLGSHPPLRPETAWSQLPFLAASFFSLIEPLQDHHALLNADQTAQSPGFQLQHGLLDLGHHIARTEISQVTT